MDIGKILEDILQIYQSFFGSYGFAIFFLVGTVKLVLLPLTVISQRATMKTQLIQPQLKEINEKYKHNIEMRNQKTQELYAEYNVSPFSPFLSCVSLLISWPVVIALFSLLQNFFKDNPVSFLWIANLAEPHHIELAIAVAIAQLASMFITSKLTGTEQPKTMRYVSIAMAVFVGWLAYTYPAALGVYWVSFSIWSIIEQVLVRKVFLRRHAIVLKETQEQIEQAKVKKKKGNKEKKDK